MEGFRLNLVHRIIAIILVAVFLIPFLGTQMTGTSLFINYQEADSESDLITATQIANMSGAATEKILALRNSGFSWNTIMDSLEASGDTVSYTNGLTEVSVYQEKLLEEGISEEEIQEVSMMIDNLVMNLEEINRYGSEEIQISEVNSLIFEISEDERFEEEIDICKRIYKQFNEGLLLYGLFHLEDNLNSRNSVMDEYLWALQAEINFELALEDYVAYQEKKQEKASMTDIIDANRISLLCVEVIQKNNEIINTKIADDSYEINSSDGISEVPKAYNDVQSPNEKLEEELRLLNPND